MTFEIDGQFVWDFWTAYDEAPACTTCSTCYAPTSLGDPELRHRNARIGHAVSADLVDLERLPDPLPARPRGVRRPRAVDGLRRARARTMVAVHHGAARSDDGRVQRIGAASPRPHDLDAERAGARGGPCALPAQQRSWVEEAWRDPWVVRGRATGCGTCTSPPGMPSGTPGCGVVGHAISEDLLAWEVQAAAELADRHLRVARGDLGGPGGGPLGAALLVPVRPRCPALRGAGGIWSVPVDGAGIARRRGRRGAGHRRDGCTSARWSSDLGSGVLHGLPKPWSGRSRSSVGSPTRSR